MNTSTQSRIKPIEASPIFELDNYTRILGYYARGSHDRVAMLQAIERYSGPIEPDTLRALDNATLKHCYARVVGDWSEGYRQSVLRWVNESGPGAFPVTVWEY